MFIYCDTVRELVEVVERLRVHHISFTSEYTNGRWCITIT